MTVLDIRVSEGPDGIATYVYELRDSDGTPAGTLEQEYTVDVHQTLVRELCGRIGDVLAEALDGSVDHRARLAEYGEALYQHLMSLAQGNVPELVARLRESTGPLLVRSNEMVVPWELLHDGSEFLGLAHDMGQRSIVMRRVVGGRRIGPIGTALVIGDPGGDLAAARHEAEHVAGLLADGGARCTVLLGERANLADVVMQLRTGRYDLLHFCGHVASGHRSADTGLMLHRRYLLDERALRGISSVGAPPVVFINGCASAARVAGICMPFMVMGAKSVIGTRAEVSEASALRFAEEFYRRLLANETAGAAVRQARSFLTGEEDAAWASFVLYGDPGVHITAGPADEPDQSATGSEVAEDGLRLDPDALELMARVYELAAARGIVTSMDLLVGLLAVAELRTWIEETAGADRLELMTEMLHTVLEGVPREEGREEVMLSDTVSRVLALAETRAAAAGRRLATPGDIAAAFAEVGGGSAAHLLELCRLSPDQLVPDRSVPARTQAEEGSASGLFDDTPEGRLRVGDLDRSVFDAIRTAGLLAKSHGEVVGTYALLLGFALTSSRTLRGALAEQGEVGERAYRRLYWAVDPRRHEFSSRTRAALDEAAHTGPDIGEAAVLRALLTDEASSAREILVGLGVDLDRLMRTLGAGDSGS